MVYIYYNTIIGERKRKLHQRLAFPYEKFVTESKPERSTIMKLEQALAAVKGEKAAELFMEMYGADGVAANVERYSHVAQGYVDTFGEGEFEFFTSPGRTEISGNHTDHNLGKILAGSINLDCVAAAGLNNSNTVHIFSETYDQNITIDLAELEPTKQKTGTVALLRGILKGFRRAGHEIGGFNAFVTSNVISAAGVSSSASFEMLICCIVDYLFNGDTLTVKDYAASMQRTLTGIKHRACWIRWHVHQVVLFPLTSIHRIWMWRILISALIRSVMICLSSIQAKDMQT